MSVKKLLPIFAATLLVQCSPPPETPEEPVAPAPETSEQAPAVPTKEGVPSLVFESEHFEIDATAEDEEVTAIFTAINNGETPVTITKLDTSCSCLSVEASQPTLAPGEKTTITAIFEIEKLVGNAEKQVIVKTDDPAFPQQFLTVEVNIPAVLEISPKMVEWSVGDAADPKPVTFRVLRDKPIKITSVTPSTKNATVELKTIEEGRHYEIFIQPLSTDESRTGMVRIETDCEMEKHQRQMAFFSVSKPAG